MKRTPLRRVTRLRNVKPLPRRPITRTTAMKARAPMRSSPRRMTPNEKRWQSAVLSLGYCVLCDRHGVQWAHRNQGKGIGLRVSPDQTAALCPGCHYAIDNGNSLSRTDRRAMMDRAIMLTHHALASIGKLPHTGDDP